MLPGSSAQVLCPQLWLFTFFFSHMSSFEETRQQLKFHSYSSIALWNVCIKHPTLEIVLLMEEIPNNHLGNVWNPVKTGTSTTSTGAGFLPSTVSSIMAVKPVDYRQGSTSVLLNGQTLSKSQAAAPPCGYELMKPRCFLLKVGD